MPGWERGRWEADGGPSGSPGVCERKKGGKEWIGAWVSCYHIKLSSPPPLVCGEEKELRWGPTGHIEPILDCFLVLCAPTVTDDRRELLTSLK